MANHQSNYTLKDFNVAPEKLRNTFSSIVGDDPLFSDLKIIFDIALKNMSLFPNFRLAKGATYTDYIQKWIKSYEDATLNPPSQRKASPKGSCSDPAIQTIVQIATNSDISFAERMSAYHNLFMSAENIQGSLLEEYISNSIRPYGWIWCNGNVLRAIDFCSIDGEIFLQIKNKSNTENSSSSAIRIGTDIKKWYRLGTQTRNGKKLPVYKWDNLNEIINSHIGTGLDPDCNMNENSYQDFLRLITSKNTNIISDK
jgi:hypothetical protein